MLIVEGPDLVGKTTLCKRIVEFLNESGRPHIYTHFSRLPVSWMNCYVRLGDRAKPVQLYLHRASMYTVQDRFHMSEPLYAAIRGDDPILNPDEYALLDSQLRGLYGMMTIVTYDATQGELIRSRWRKDEMYDLEKVLEVNAHYTELAKSPGQLWRDYRLTFDCVVPLSSLACDPWPIVNVFLDRYVARQSALEKL